MSFYETKGLWEVYNNNRPKLHSSMCPYKLSNFIFNQLTSVNVGSSLVFSIWSKQSSNPIPFPNLKLPILSWKCVSTIQAQCTSHQRSRSPVVENHGGHKKGLRFIPHEILNIFGFRKHRKLLQFCLWQGSFGAASGGSGDWRWWFHLCSGEERFCQGFKNTQLPNPVLKLTNQKYF